MVSIYTNLVLALQLWTISSIYVQAQLSSIPEPPYHLSVMPGNFSILTFTCRAGNGFDVGHWVLYRNGVPENTTDPCISAGNYFHSVLTISSECDGLYSCGVGYNDSIGNFGLVLSVPIAVYGKFLCAWFLYMFRPFYGLVLHVSIRSTTRCRNSHNSRLSTDWPHSIERVLHTCAI